MIIIGIDPGLGRIGYGLIDHSAAKTIALCYGCISSSKEKKIGGRLVEIEKDLSLILKKWKPKLASIEELYFAKNTKTAFSVGQARGVILLVLTKAKIPIIAYSPPKIKLAVTGYGAADKRQVQEMVKQLLSLNEIPKPDDAADALAIALCAAAEYPRV